MKTRTLGKTGYEISEISLGTWQLGSKWGDPFNEDVAMKTLEAACENGINFFDTADVYQGGLSEKAIGKFLKTRSDKVYVVTKSGRRLNPHNAEGYNEANIRRFVDDSRRNMDVDALDLVLLHCPPTPVYTKQEAFDTLDALKAEGRIKHYGVSIEKVEEGLLAMRHDVSAIEIIYNMFRLKPEEEFFPAAKKNNIGVIVRVPLASGLLSGKYTLQTTFGPEDHRTFNREGAAFDKGETFSGVDYAKGVEAAKRLQKELGVESLPVAALKYILMQDAVSTVIPGASRPEQIVSNVKASEAPDLTPDQIQAVKKVYDEDIRPLVHHLW